jgi:hypothetical protein
VSSIKLSAFLVCTSLWLLTIGTAGHAQTSEPPALGERREDGTSIPRGHIFGLGEEGSEPAVGDVVAAGMGLGAAGFLAGGLTAASFSRGCTSGEYCQLAAVFYGAAAGGTLGMAVGVHLGNRRRGNLALDFMTGAAIWIAGIAVVSSSDWDEGVTKIAFVAIPAGQLAGTVAVERAVGRAWQTDKDVTVSVAPGPDGSAALVVSLAF